MKQITIYDLLPLLKKGWVAMDRSGKWWWFSNKPFMFHEEWHFNSGRIFAIYKPFNIAPFDSGWKNSLLKVSVFTRVSPIKIEHKEGE